MGRYEKGDIKAAALDYFSTAKYSRWPEEGQIIELLKAAYAKPESEVVVRGEEVGIRHASLLQ